MDANTAASGARKRILCVDDHADTNEVMRFMLNANGYDTVIAASVSDALEHAAFGGFALYILDNWLGQSSGTYLCERIRAFDRHTPIMFYSAAGYKADIQEGMNAGAQAYVVKPDFDRLEQTIDRLIL